MPEPTQSDASTPSPVDLSRLSLYQFFGPGGVLSQRHPAYEFRKGQLAMANAVEEAIELYCKDGKPLPPATSGRDFANRMQQVARPAGGVTGPASPEAVRPFPTRKLAAPCPLARFRPVPGLQNPVDKNPHQILIPSILHPSLGTPGPLSRSLAAWL